MTIKKRLSQILGLKGNNREDYDQRQFILDALPRHSTGVEIGVHEGDFSRLLLTHVRPARLHLIDPWEYRPEPEYAQSYYGGQAGVDQYNLDQRYNRVLKRLHKHLQKQQVIIHRQRSSKVTESFPPDYFDWIYIDGDHLYQQVRQDLEEFGQRVKPGGWIAGGGFRSGAWWCDGVVRAVEEYVASTPHQQYITHGDQFLIRVALA